MGIKLIESGSSRTLWLRILIVVTGMLVMSTLTANAAIAGHTHRHTSVNREREEDGAFAPRSAAHYGNSDKKTGSGHDLDHNLEFDHEAILGSTKEAEEFDNLPPEEAKRRLKILIDKMDLDKNGLIEKAELKAWIMRSFTMLSEEETQERFDEADENSDGRVSWKEYVEETFGVDADETAIPMESLEEAKMLADDKALFAGADKNKDGFLDLKEYLPFTHPEEDPEMLPIVLKQTLDEKDLNGDGQIDFKEYIGDRGKDKTQEWLIDEKAKFDMEHDKDGDGLLSRQEILSWILPSNEEIAEDEVRHLFAASDDDHSMTLTYNEILDHHDVFVGSEATDYGDHLHYMDRFTDEL